MKPGDKILVVKDWKKSEGVYPVTAHLVHDGYTKIGGRFLKLGRDCFSDQKEAFAHARSLAMKAQKRLEAEFRRKSEEVKQAMERISEQMGEV